VRIKG